LLFLITLLGVFPRIPPNTTGGRLKCSALADAGPAARTLPSGTPEQTEILFSLDFFSMAVKGRMLVQKRRGARLLHSPAWLVSVPYRGRST